MTTDQYATTSANLPKCRFCSAPLRQTFVDLGMSPLCQSHIAEEWKQMVINALMVVIYIDGAAFSFGNDFKFPKELFCRFAKGWEVIGGYRQMICRTTGERFPFFSAAGHDSNFLD